MAVGEHLGDLFGSAAGSLTRTWFGRCGWSCDDADVVGAELGGERAEAGVQIFGGVARTRSPRQSFEAAVLGFGRVGVRERRAERRLGMRAAASMDRRPMRRPGRAIR